MEFYLSRYLVINLKLKSINQIADPKLRYFLYLDWNIYIRRQ